MPTRSSASRSSRPPTSPAGPGRARADLAVELPELADKPAVFSTFLMWLLADLFHDLPEVGDIDKPKLVFFFDEAHLLFDDASEDFLDQIAQTVRLIRSKGVGVFFVTQSPTDVPDEVLAQLGSRVQHQLRAHTPNDAKALKADRRHLPHSSYDDLGEVITTPRHRRGGRHGDGRARRADARGVDPAARAGVADGTHRPGGDGGDGAREPAQRHLRRHGRPGVGPRAAGEAARGGGGEGRGGGARPRPAARRRPRPSRRSRRRRTTASSTTSSSRAPSRTSCAQPPARSRAGCSRPAGATALSRRGHAVQRTASSTRSARAWTPRRSSRSSMSVVRFSAWRDLRAARCSRR